MWHNITAVICTDIYENKSHWKVTDKGYEFDAYLFQIVHYVEIALNLYYFVQILLLWFSSGWLES